MQGGNKVFWLVGGCPPQLLYRAAAALEVCDLDRNCLTRGRGEHPGSGVSWRLRNPLINDEVVIDPYLGAIIGPGSELIHPSRGKRDRAPQAHGPIISPYLRNRSTRTPISGDHPTVGPGKPQRVRGGGTGQRLVGVPGGIKPGYTLIKPGTLMRNRARTPRRDTPHGKTRRRSRAVPVGGSVLLVIQRCGAKPRRVRGRDNLILAVPYRARDQPGRGRACQGTPLLIKTHNPSVSNNRSSPLVLPGDINTG